MPGEADGPSSRSIIRIDALGAVVDVHGSQDIPLQIRRLITEAWRDSVADDSARVSRTLTLATPVLDDLEGFLSDISTRVTLEALDALRGRRLLLHAAGVADERGNVVALIGPSGRGKTTAARHLGQQFGYVSDETVAVDTDLAVAAYRKPLSVITAGHHHKLQLAPSELELRPLPDRPLRLRALTLIERAPHAEDIGPVPMDTIDAICEMTPQISYLPELPAPLQHLARLFDAVGAPTRLVYRDATELPTLVQVMFDSPRPPAQTWAPAPPPTSEGPWRTVDVDDAILVDGRACILRDGIVTALDQRGRLAWVEARRGATTEQIAVAAVAEFGEPDDGSAHELITATLEELRAHGLIEGA